MITITVCNSTIISWNTCLLVEIWSKDKDWMQSNLSTHTNRHLSTAFWQNGAKFILSFGFWMWRANIPIITEIYPLKWMVLMCHEIRFSKVGGKSLSSGQVFYHGLTKRSASIFKHCIAPHRHFKTYYTFGCWNLPQLKYARKIKDQLVKCRWFCL